MNLDTTAVTPSQLLDVVDALQGAVATKKDLIEFADTIDRVLPELVRKAAPHRDEPRCCPRTSFVFRIHRDEAGRIDTITAAPLE